MRRAAMILIGLSLAGTAGCELMPDPTALTDLPTTIQVHSLLRAGATGAAVLVTRVDPDGGAAPYTNASPVTDARVFLIHGADTVSLAADPDGQDGCIQSRFVGDAERALRPGCYVGPIPGGAVLAGETYELRVEMPGRGPILGEATIPDVPRLIAPAPDERVVYRGWIHPRWDLVPDRRVEIHVEPEPAGCYGWVNSQVDNGGTSGLDFLNVDSASVWISHVNCEQDAGTEAAPDSIDGNVVLTVHDAASTEYTMVLDRGGSSIGHDDAGPGLTGAYGVFGGVAEARVRVRLIAEGAGF